MYQTLTDYLSVIGNDCFGKWIIDKNRDGTLENPILMPYVEYSQMVERFTKDIYLFSLESIYCFRHKII